MKELCQAEKRQVKTGAIAATKRLQSQRNRRERTQRGEQQTRTQSLSMSCGKSTRLLPDDVTCLSLSETQKRERDCEYAHDVNGKAQRSFAGSEVQAEQLSQSLVARNRKRPALVNRLRWVLTPHGHIPKHCVLLPYKATHKQHIPKLTSPVTLSSSMNDSMREFEMLKVT